MNETERRILLIEWTQAQAKLAEVKPLVENEMRLRKQVMTEYFPTPVEGVNTCQLESGWEMKATYRIDRKIDEAALPAINTSSPAYSRCSARSTPRLHRNGGLHER